MSSAARAFARAHDHVQVTRRARGALFASAAITLLLYLVPFGGLLIYPLLLLSTLAHELGHGLAALATGGTFHAFYLWPDGSGMAVHSGPEGHVLQAIVAAGGLIGPAIVAGLCFALARRPAVARVVLGLLGLGFLAAVALVVENPFGFWYISGVGLLLLALAARASATTAQTALVFVAVQLALSVFSRADYLFTASAQTSAGVMPSDSAHIAAALGGSYLLWGAVCGLFSVLVLVLGLWLFTRGESRVSLANLRR
ncbi:M50 family metallopeptidase [Nannocystis bainbridge]|uniref:M50 family metallopeptidase n=1 Tax=Nannocystis bainbridge TaxID=2995303 RepID=A0ABT5DX71_9BACT|nr:M50 family metallopeptidase [Nannocystis bainbridge]MDC0718227.1 M50 family metallopeptidase [Nannocystis bainbridge]